MYNHGNINPPHKPPACTSLSSSLASLIKQLPVLVSLVASQLLTYSSQLPPATVLFIFYINGIGIFFTIWKTNHSTELFYT